MLSKNGQILANHDIRKFAKTKGVYLWEIAEYLNVSDPTLTRKLRVELPLDEKYKISAIIENIADAKKKGVSMDLFDKIDQLKAALDRKDELKEQTKENNSEIAALKEEIAQMMIDAECPTISRNGFKYSLQEKVCYSKKSEEALQEAGIDFHAALRSAGFGDLIVETVNQRSLQSSLANYVDEHDELPEQLAPAINVYEMFDIQKRKETSRAGKKKVAE